MLSPGSLTVLGKGWGTRDHGLGLTFSPSDIMGPVCRGTSQAHRKPQAPATRHRRVQRLLSLWDPWPGLTGRCQGPSRVPPQVRCKEAQGTCRR